MPAAYSYDLRKKAMEALDEGESREAVAARFKIGRIIALFTIIRTDRNMLLACYSHKHISYRIRTIVKRAIMQCDTK